MKRTKDFQGNLNLLLIFSLLAVFFVSILFVFNWPAEQGFTEMWLVPGSYPKNVSIGEIVSFSVGLGNMEGISRDYTLNLDVNDEFIRYYQIQLDNEQEIISELSFDVPENSSFPIKVEISLSDQDNDLWFWLEKN